MFLKNWRSPASGLAIDLPCFFFRNSLIKACFDRDLHRVLAPLNFLCRQAADENDKSCDGDGFTCLSFHKVLLNLGHLKTSVGLVLVID